MEEAYKSFMDAYSGEIFNILLLAFVLAVVSHYLVIGLLRSIFNNRDKEERFKPVAFFLVDMLLIILIGHREVTEYKVLDWFELVGLAVFISGISLVIYNYLPAIISTIASKVGVDIAVIDDEEEEEEETE